MSTAGIIAFHNREAVKVKAKVSGASLHHKQMNGSGTPNPLSAETRRFSVDPRITTFEVLQTLLSKAFDIRGVFTIHYLAKDDEGKETYLGLLSDWDLDAAFLSSSVPCLNLLLDLKPYEEGLEEWDVITAADLTKIPIETHIRSNAQHTSNFLMLQMEKTLKTISKFQKVLALAPDVVRNGVAERQSRASKPPMSNREFQNFLDSDGRLVQPQELRRSVFLGGVEPSMRPIIWKHILNVYPDGLNRDQRIHYLKDLANDYYTLRRTWTDMQKRGVVSEEMQYIINMVSKDVLRTDRTHRFYAGNDDNKNVAKLHCILTTFALNHPSVSYCQGMSDLASPMLVIMKDEAHAYICFTALMQRLKPNFNINGLAVTEKFAHLSLLLQHYDPQFFEYLKTNGADDLLYCYRWLLLELKREFSFDDALCMLEVLWSSLPASPPPNRLSLYEIRFGMDSVHPQSPRIRSRENPYTKVRRIRKQSSSSSLICVTPKAHGMSEMIEDFGDSRRSSDGENSEYCQISNSITNDLRMDLENLNKTVLDARESPSRMIHFETRGSVESDQTLTKGILDEEHRESWKSRKNSQGYCGTPDEQIDIDFDCEGDNRVSNHGRRHLSSQTSLDRRRSGSSVSASTSGSSHSGDLMLGKGEDSDFEEEALFRAKSVPSQSEGYGSEMTLSSKEASCQEDNNSVLDSGMLEFSRDKRPHLPPPGQLGGGNPFMMFLCLTLLLQHRDKIIRNHMDYDELAIHFDKMVRKHNVHKVLHETRIRFKEYLQIDWESSWEEQV